MSRTRRRGAVWGLLRVALLGVVLLAIAFWLGLGSAKAALGERLLGFGADLARWENLRLTTAPRRLSVNGAELELVVATTQLPVTDALDRLENVCQLRGGIVGAEVLPKVLASTGSVARSWLNGRVRKESTSEGVLACLDTGAPLAVDELTSRLQRFAQSGDLSELGALRYATARRTGNVTTVLFIWSQGVLPLREMFPKEADAPGFDAPGVPRPHGSIRLLSGAEHGAPYAVGIYRTPMRSPEALVDWYRPVLAKAGFSVADAPHGALLARQGTRTLLIRAANTSSGVASVIAELK